MIDQLVQVCCPSGSSPELLDPVECSNWEVLKLRTEVQRCNVRTSNSASRSDIGRVAIAIPSNVSPHSSKKSSNSKVKNGNSKLTSLDDALKPSHSTIAPITWTIPKTTPSNPSGNGVSNRRTTDPSGEIIPGCRSARNSSSFPPSNVSARIAVNRYVSELIPKTPSRSRSTCAYRRKLRRRRYERTCTCEGSRTLTAPPPPKLIPKGWYGISLWVEMFLDKYFTYRPTERSWLPGGCWVWTWRRAP